MMLFVAQHHHSLPFFVSNHVGHQEGRSEIRRYDIIFLHPHRVRYLKTLSPWWSRCQDARCPGCHPDRVTSPDIMILILPDRRGDHGPVPNWFYHSHIYHHYALHIHQLLLMFTALRNTNTARTNGMSCHQGNNPFRILINLIILSEISRCYY